MLDQPAFVPPGGLQVAFDRDVMTDRDASRFFFFKSYQSPTPSKNNKQIRLLLWPLTTFI